MTFLSSRARGYGAALGVFLGLAGAIWKWCPGAITQITSDHYSPHGFCYLWNQQLITLHVVSDSIIFLSYLSISCSLGWLLYRFRREFVFAWIFVAFGFFILACGFTHALDIVVLWEPLYWLSGDLKFITAMASLTTAVVLPCLFPGLRALLNEARSSRLNASRFLAITDSSNDGFYLLEAVRDAATRITDFRFIFLNEKGAGLISGTPESIQGELLCVRHPINRTNGLFEEYKHVVETGKRLDLILPIEADNINASWLHLQVMKVEDGVAITTQNISQQKEGERRLAETSARFRLLIEGVKDHAVFTIDTTGLVTSWNRGAERLLGYGEADIIGRNISCFLTAQDLERGLAEKMLDTAVQQGRAEEEGWRLSADARCFYANVTITSMLEDPNMYFGFAVVVQDKTEQRNVAIAQEEVREERTRLQENFLSHVSHELRTPLTAAYFFASNVLDGLFGDLNPEQHEHLLLGVDNLDQLKDMVSDLLDITRNDAHKFAVAPQRVSPVDLSAEVLSTCSRNSATANVHLESAVSPDLPYLWADPVRCRQILINLIDNGVKFTPPNGTVSVACTVHGEDRSFLCFSVTDTGCGIEPKNLELVFDRLAQVEGSIISSRSGLGLGLFIARELVLLQGGRIWVESKLGQGSTFFFTVPVFSIARMCASILTAPKFWSSAALISVDVEAEQGVVNAEALVEIRKILELCIREGQDVLLPSMREGEREDIFFIVASSTRDDVGAVTSRISKELKTFDIAGQLKPLISAEMLPQQRDKSKDQWIGEIVREIDRAVQRHIQRSI